MDAEMANIELTSDGGVVLRRWDETQMQINGAAVVSHTRTIGDSAATVIDLPPVAIMVLGPTARRHEWRHIVDVSKRLNDYVYLPARGGHSP